VPYASARIINITDSARNQVYVAMVHGLRCMISEIRSTVEVIEKTLRFKRADIVKMPGA